MKKFLLIALLLTYKSYSMECSLNEDSEQLDESGESSLMSAVRQRNYELAKFLLENVACDVNLKNNKGETAFMIATESRNVNIIKLLRAFGADVTVKNNEGYTAIDKLLGLYP